jgi:hypothetical protein
VLAIFVFLLILLFGGLGFAIHLLWIAAAIFLIVWVVGFIARGAERTWYRW